jgi:extracellular elastinolytic metalloproteinase
VLVASASANAQGRDPRSSAPRDHGRPFFDVRAAAGAAAQAANPAQAALERALGLDAVVEIDGLTGTPSAVARRDGFLTAPSTRDARAVVLDYVRARPGVFKLDAGDLAGLRIARDYADVGGTRHLVWEQVSRGIPLFGNGLYASVTSDGHLVNVQGAPVSDLRAPAAPARLSARDALDRTFRSVGRPAPSARVLSLARGAERTTRFSGGHRAGLVLLYDGGAARLAWNVLARAGTGEIYGAAVDAMTGALLYRANRVDSVNAKVFDYYPGAAVGGTQRDQDITAWLHAGATTLTGPNTHVFADLVDNPQHSATVDAGGEVGRSDGTNWNYVFDTSLGIPAGFCNVFSQCSWDSYDNDPSGSWRTNYRQNATQAFYYVNNFHDHLAGPPFGFDDAAGAFDSSEDPVIAQTNDGAQAPTSTFLGPDMPNPDHLNNANMFTPPDGFSPEMQMYLFTSFTGPDVPNPDTTPDVNGGDDASVVYHEYVHGLTNRLLTYPDGWGALERHQPGAMGEAWSDWYAMDYLEAQGFETDDPLVPGDIRIGEYLANGATFRSQATDCPRGSGIAACPGTSTAGTGGYTLRDLGRVAPSGPQVHADGEIWAETLWQLRTRLIAEHGEAEGIDRARTLITRALQLSGPEPTFLRMRDWILQADLVRYANEDRNLIWGVFANRGMGFLAWTAGANSVSTVEDFSLPRTLSCLGKTATKIGTNGPDTINGTNGPDVIVGMGGNDKINGRGGNDLICGGNGKDTLTGAGGVDKFDGGPSADTLFTRDSRRELTIKGGTGTDRARKDKSDRTSSVERFF